MSPMVIVVNNSPTRLSTKTDKGIRGQKKRNHNFSPEEPQIHQLKPGQVILFKEPLENMKKPGRLQTVIRHAPNTNVTQNRSILSSQRNSPRQNLSHFAEPIVEPLSPNCSAVRWANSLINQSVNSSALSSERERHPFTQVSYAPISVYDTMRDAQKLTDAQLCDLWENSSPIKLLRE